MLQLCISYLIEISAIYPAEYKLPSIRETCICMLFYAYENEVLKLALENVSESRDLNVTPHGRERTRGGVAARERGKGSILVILPQ